ncbi:MAG: peptidoglycan DD-metalloendopeptidase family protein [Bacilli bacterium]
MKIKDIIITIVLSIGIIVLYFINEQYNIKIDIANASYKVYLDGEMIGLIKDENELYDLINNKQIAIKNEYNVDYVYPPDVFEIIKTNTYSSNYTTADEIYKMIEERDDFTIKGYTITIKYTDSNQENGEIPDDFVINVLDPNIFYDAIKSYVLAFVSEKDYNNFMNGEIEELDDIGQVITNMYFQENIMIRESLISINDKIYTESDSLTQDLLFGVDAEMDNYVVKAGDSINSISDEFNLNPQEFLIANPDYRSENVMLNIGDTVNVTLINPIVTFIYNVYRIEEAITPYSTKTDTDYSKPYGYKEITQAGITGLSLNYETYQVKNGEASSQINIEQTVPIRTAVTEITIVGPTRPGITGSYINLEGEWGWPTNQPSVITSRYYLRWGKLHEGIDISGTGYGSPIYAIADGVAVNVSPECKSCYQWSNGNYIVIKHDNNLYSVYAHLSGFNITEGQQVKRGDIIGFMGNSGFVTGTHLHLGLYQGEPFAGGYSQSMDPLSTIYAGL